jgi:CubicO group peptidase (beta-lactamase class C family)
MNSAKRNRLYEITWLWWAVGLLGLLAACSRPAAAPAVAPTPQATATSALAATLPATEPTPTPAATPPPAETAAPEVAMPEAAAIDAFLATAFDGAPFRGAVLAARAGEMILRRGYGLADAEQNIANGPETRFRLGSVTKPITALAVLTLVAADKLDVQQPVCVYLTDCPSAWQPITLHHLLSHTSGIPDLTRFANYEATKAQPSTPSETLARFSGRPLDFAPGTAWDYSNSNYIVLGAIIEQVTGQSYADYVQTAIFDPLGMASSGYDYNLDTLAVGYRPDGTRADFLDMSIPFAAGALYSTVDDLYTLDRGLVAGTLLPAEIQAGLFTPHATIPDRARTLGYGYGWIVEEGPQGTVLWHSGSIEGFSAGLARYVEPDVVIVVLSNEEQRNPQPVIDGIAAILIGQ